MITILNHSNSHRNVHDLYSTSNTRVTRRVPLVEQELPTFPEHLCSALFLVWCALCLKFCVHTIVSPFCFVHLLSILLRLMDSDYPFLIFKLFLLYIKWYNIFRILVTRQQYHRKRKRKRKQITIVRILIFVVYLWNVWKQNK